MTVYIGFYIDKAKSGGELVGQKITYKHFSDGIMECKHKESKHGNFVFNGGRQGPMGKHEYQQRILHQQGLSEFIRTENHRKLLKLSLHAKGMCAEN